MSYLGHRLFINRLIDKHLRFLDILPTRGLQCLFYFARPLRDLLLFPRNCFFLIICPLASRLCPDWDTD